MEDFKKGKISQEYTEDVPIVDRSWIILNHLEEFNNCPEKIVAILERLSKLKEHKLGAQEQYYHRAYNGYYVLHDKFPDIGWIREQCPGSELFIRKGNYSESIYLDFVKIMDREIVKKTMERFSEISCPTSEDIEKVRKVMDSYEIKNVEDIMDTPEERSNYYDDGEDLSEGIKTGILELDEVIHQLECMGSSVIAAPSGSGKTTIASSIGYNVALSGKHVCYVAFEGTRTSVWFNFCSIESTYMDAEYLCSHSKWKHREEDKGGIFRKCSDSLNAKLKESNGILNIVDSKRLHAETFEDFIGTLERQSVLAGRKVDLFILDNVDGLDRFKSYERDRKEAMNARIKRLDALATTYHKNEGTHMMFLSQTNRTGMATLADQDNNAAQGATSDQKGAKKTKKVDFTVISEFNALYEKAVVALVCSSSDNAREEKLMAINIVKVRNSERPPEFIKVYADFAYCKVGHRAPVLVENSVSLEEKFVKYKKACEVLNYVPKTTVEDDFNNDDE